MATLKINDIIVNLGEKRLVFSKAGYSFDDWITKDIPYSEAITLPESSQLNYLFQRPQNIEIAASQFKTLYKFTYSDFDKIIFSGVAILQKFNKNKEYELQLLDSSYELFLNLKDNINALNVDEYDFIFNTTSYNALKTLTSNVWLWSIGSFHEKKNNTKIPPGTLAFSRPFFSMKRLLELIFTENNWSYELSNASNEIDELLISAKNEFVFTSYEKLYNETLAISGTQQLDLTGTSFIKTDTITGNFTLNLNYETKIRLRGQINATSDFQLQIIGNTVSGDTLTQEIFINKGINEIDFTSELFKTDNPTYNLTFSFIGNGSITFTDFYLYTIIDENAFGSIVSAIFTDFKVKTYDNMPEISQINQFKHSLVPKGVFFTSDNFRKKLKINSVNELSKLNSLDWSDKYIEGSAEIEPLTGYGKTNYYKYNNSDNKAENIGRGVFTINNNTLPDITNVYTSIFEASPEVVIDGITMLDNNIYDDTERLNERNVLLAYYSNVSDYTVARFDKLNGTNILNNFYSNFIKAIQKGVIVEAEFNLNKTDFSTFDFTKLIYVESLKTIFYCIKIYDYMENEPTKLKLLKT